MLRERIERQEARNRGIWADLALSQQEMAHLQTPEEPGQKGEGAGIGPKTLIDLGAEAWSLAQSARGWAEQLGERRQRRAWSRIEWFQTRLVEILGQEEIVLQDLTGQIWNEGDAVEVLNPAEPEADQQAKITNMLEPIIIHRGRVVRRGKVSITLEGGTSK